MVPPGLPDKKIKAVEWVLSKFTLRQPFFIEKVPLLCNFHGQTGFPFDILGRYVSVKTHYFKKVEYGRPVNVILNRNRDLQILRRERP